MKRLIAIDPGASGCIAVQWEDGKIEATPMPDEQGIVEALEEHGGQSYHGSRDAVTCYIEKVGGYIGEAQPGSRAFNFGKNAGFIEGCLMMANIPYILVPPQRWQKGLPGLTGKKGPERKRALKAEAARRFPHLKPTLKTADALLILSYARREEGNDI
jgi:hypothetical protein